MFGRGVKKGGGKFHGLTSFYQIHPKNKMLLPLKQVCLVEEQPEELKGMVKINDVTKYEYTLLIFTFPSFVPPSLLLPGTHP